MSTGAQKAVSALGGPGAAAANAIPIAGQFLSFGLGIAKLFAGKQQREQRSEEEARQRRSANASRMQQAATAGQGGSAEIQAGQDPEQATSAVAPPSLNISEFIPGEDFPIQDNPFLGIIDNG